jgi:peptidoglycan/xylan/chitin deacetylase (PgdA/CDA1 family)
LHGRRVSSRIVNLTFHGIGPLPPSLLVSGDVKAWIDEPLFRTIMETVSGRDDVLVTFDDGNTSDVRVGLPTLVELGLRATFFIVAGRLDTAGFVSQTDIRRLVDAGMQIGLHGFHHRSWRGLEDEELRQELVLARTALEDASGTIVRTAALPFGAYDRRVLAALRAEGYSRVFTSDGGATNADCWLQPRNSVRTTDDAAVVERILAADRRVTTRMLLGVKRAVKSWR